MLIETDVVRISYDDYGDRSAPPVVLLHGFPYDSRAFDSVFPILVRRGFRVIVPMLRGFGATRYISNDAVRSGQQEALGADLIALIEALELKPVIAAGYDWGGRAACVASVIRPDLIRGLVTGQGYNIFDVTCSGIPAPPEDEFLYWYQWYLHGERGRNGLIQNRSQFCRLLWTLWSPSWRFSDEEFESTAASFENPDFVATVVHSYRHRYGLVEGDSRYADIENALSGLPAIDVPAIAVVGDSDGVHPSSRGLGEEHFTSLLTTVRLAHCGHNLPQEKPMEFAALVNKIAHATGL